MAQGHLQCLRFGLRVRIARSAGSQSGEACPGNPEEKIEQRPAFLFGEVCERGSQNLVGDLVTGHERTLTGRGQAVLDTLAATRQPLDEALRLEPVGECTE